MCQYPSLRGEYVSVCFCGLPWLKLSHSTYATHRLSYMSHAPHKLQRASLHDGTQPGCEVCTLLHTQGALPGKQWLTLSTPSEKVAGSNKTSGQCLANSVVGIAAPRHMAVQACLIRQVLSRAQEHTTLLGNAAAVPSNIYYHLLLKNYSCP